VIPGPYQGMWQSRAPAWNEYLTRPTAEFQFFGQNGGGGLIAYIGVLPIVLFVLGLARGPRRTVVLWAACALTFLGLALGPSLHVYGEIYSSAWLPLPYRLLLLAPHSLTKMFRAPYYFFAPALFAFWVVAAFGARVLLRACGMRQGVAALCLWLALDYGRPPVQTYDLVVPDAYAKIAADPLLIKILEVPLLDFWALEYYSFLQTVHGKPLVRGFIGRRDPWIARRDAMLKDFLSRSDLDVLLSSLGPTYIIVHKEEWVKYTPWNVVLAQAMNSLHALVKLHDDELVTVYALGLPRDDG